METSCNSVKKHPKKKEEIEANKNNTKNPKIFKCSRLFKKIDSKYYYLKFRPQIIECYLIFSTLF